MFNSSSCWTKIREKHEKLFSIWKIHVLTFCWLHASFHPWGERGYFSKLPAFSYQLESHTGKLIWLFKTSMHPTFTCAMPCPHSGRWYSVNVLRELDHLKQHDNVSPADWSHAAPAQHNKPPACVLDRCVAASLMHACNYNTSPSVCVLGGETWWVLPYKHCSMTTNEDRHQLTKEYGLIRGMWR